jgi:hypothetical protein
MPSSLRRFMDDIPEMEIRNGLVYVDRTASTEPHVLPISTLRALYRRIGAVLAMHDAQQSNVVEMRRAEH